MLGNRSATLTELAVAEFEVCAAGVGSVNMCTPHDEATPQVKLFGIGLWQIC